MKIVTFISDEQDKLPPPEDIEKLIEDCTAAALEEEGIDDSAEVSVTFVDNEGIRELNKELRETGCITIAGRIDRKFFHEKFYGTREPKERRESNGSV